MIKNPFTPIFGGKPQHFFGRKEILTRFDAALVDPGSEDRALFVTGARGSGKTALVEQLSRRAHRAGWRTIDVGADNTTHLLMRGLQTHDEESRSVDPQVSVNVLGSGASLGGVSSTKSTHFDTSDLQYLFLHACKSAEKGMFVSIDEAQKVPVEELSAISNAFQMSSRKGYDAILVLAGLPYSYDTVIHHEGCTFMRRAAHEELGLLARDEVREAFVSMLGTIGGLVIKDTELEALTNASYGHPYVIQLLGYYVIAQLNASSSHVSQGHTLMKQEVDDATRMAVLSYERRALKPLLEELSHSERDFIRAMSSALDDKREARISSIAAHLGKEQRALSPVRDSLIKNGIIISVGRGRLMFNVPYLAAYAQKDAGADGNQSLVRSWRL